MKKNSKLCVCEERKCPLFLKYYALMDSMKQIHSYLERPQII